ncbi:MAG TPA: peptidase inhibitor family I36 protein [Alphaproteobacteria bacterium]|nr:peptidase inhibitor family I36 protein [Alphaproteobacteria bacterium]
MNLIKNVSLALAFAGALAVPGLAQAEQSTVHLNVHSGPSTGYPVTDVLSPGEHVDVIRRSGSWCYVDKAGRNGWSVCRYLTADEPGPRPGPSYDNGPSVSLGFSIPGFRFQVGPGGFNVGPRPGRNAQVCFYQNHNYNGQSLCLRPGQGYARLHTWNDNISSIRVSGNAQARVCEDWKFSGNCKTITSDDRNLGNHDNKISSIRVTAAGNGNGNGNGRGQVCFYQNKHYNGRSLCVSPGHGYAQLHTWNDKISSIRVSGGAEAQVCEDYNYGGHCVTVDRNIADLGNRGNNQISSLRVR